jgi:hypothetical protein
MSKRISQSTELFYKKSQKEDVIKMEEKKLPDQPNKSAEGEEKIPAPVKLTPEQQQVLDGSAAEIEDKDGFVLIKLQCGPVAEVGVNGTTIENVIRLLINRLAGFQRGHFACSENERAIIMLDEALLWLNIRTQNRKTQGVEGKNQPHNTAK